MLRIVLTLLLSTLVASCATTRTPVPVGEIPAQDSVITADEQYGHQVFQQLAQRFPLDNDDGRILRVREITERLTEVRGNNQNIWHVHVFKDDNFKNAAATRGNYIFIWSGLINTVDDDDELSTILAHEIGHVLAGHTKPDPVEEVNAMLASITGQTTQRIMATAGNPTVGGLANLGGLVAVELMKAILINPNKQQMELEADRLGLFIMAEAGYNPDKAITFWEKVKDDPSFRGAPVDFLSTHPSSNERLKELKKILPLARDRYLGRSNTEPFTPESADQKSTFVVDYPPTKREFTRTTTSPEPVGKSSYRQEEIKRWRVMDFDTPVFSKTHRSSALLKGKLKEGELIEALYRDGRWLKIEGSVDGYVESYHLSPVR